MNLVQIWKLKLKMKYLVHILRLVVILIVSPGSKLPVAVGKGCGSSVSAKIPMAPGAGVHKAESSRKAALSVGLRKAAQDWSVLSKLYK